MRTTGARAASASPTPSTPSSVAPARSACVPAAWMTGPSASGSEYGTPSSSRSPPWSRHASPIAREPSSDGKPPIRYGMSAACLPWPAKAAAMRSVPGKDLGEVLVPAARQADQVEIALGLLEHPRDRVRRLQRRDDPLDRGQLVEGGDRLLVGDGLVARAAAVAQEGVLGPAARIVEPGGDRVRLGDLPVVVLHDRAQRPVQHARAAAGGQRRAVAAGLDPVARALDPDQLDVGVVYEAREHPDGVRAAVDAGDHAARQAAGALQDL